MVKIGVGIFVLSRKPHSSREIDEAICAVLGQIGSTVERTKVIICDAMSPAVRYNTSKLLGDDCYYSEKLQSLGFKAQCSLRELNETSI